MAEAAVSGSAVGWRVAARPLRLFRAIGLGRCFALAFLAALIALQIWSPVPVEILRVKTFDFYQVLAPREIAVNTPVAIVDIDENSLALVGQWPWPRTVIADLVAKVTRMGATAIAFDVVFAEEDRSSPAAVADALPGLDDAIRAELRALPGNDALLANAFRDARVVVGQAGHRRARGDRGDPRRRIIEPPLAFVGTNRKPRLFTFEGLVRNIQVLAEAAAGHALFSLTGEQDGIVRRVPLLTRVQDKIVPALSLELLRVAAGGGALAVKTDRAGIKSVVLAGKEIATDNMGRLWVHYSRHDAGKYVSAAAILNDEVEPAALANKLVLIGTSATGLLDIKTTPVERGLPGVEVHAQVLEAILTDALLERPNYAIGAEVMMTAAAGLFMIVLVPIAGALFTLVIGAAMAVTMVWFSWYLYTDEKLILDVGYALLASLVLYGTLVYVNYFREETRRRQVRGAFGQYLSPALVAQLAENPDRLQLGGETKRLTFLFCDVRGFTAISERHKDDPQGLTRLINRLLTPMTEAILRQQGTIDKYMGDCVMAFWNAPLDDKDHVAHACRSALDMLTAVDRVNAARREEDEAAGQPHLPLKVGIGINSGDCVVGNMGSEQRFDYSVLGDAVNLASRLEGQSKTYGVSIVIGEDSIPEIEDRYAVLELDLIAVKGKREPVRVFALLGDETLLADPDFARLAERNGDLLRCRRARDWDGAEAAAVDCRAILPGLELGELYDLHEARIADYRAGPPDPDWDGVFVARTK